MKKVRSALGTLIVEGSQPLENSCLRHNAVVRAAVFCGTATGCGTNSFQINPAARSFVRAGVMPSARASIKCQLSTRRSFAQ